MKVLITGGAGFLGQHLVRWHLRNGDQVTVLDNFHTGRELDDDIAGRVQTVFGEIQDYISDDSAICNLEPHDAIYNMACPASPVHYQKDPINTLDTCYLGTKAMLMLAIGWKAKFLQASTSEVYGNPAVTPQPESYWGNVNSYGPRACYDEGKRVAEALAWAHAPSLGTNLKIVRIFNTYGPGMALDDGRMIPEFFKSAIKNKPIVVHGDGLQTRSLCFVDDLVKGMTTFMLTDLGGAIINLGMPEEHTVLNIAQRVKMLCGSSSEIVYSNRPVDDPDRRVPDITKARHVLRWEPKIDLENGLLRCLPYFAEEVMQ